jgi:hypothetical protein
MRPHIVNRIRAKIAAGQLPLLSSAPGKLWVGRGNGRPCDACDQPITHTEAEYETDLATGQTIRFHRPCFEAWNTEQPQSKV